MRTAAYWVCVVYVSISVAEMFPAGMPHHWWWRALVGLPTILCLAVLKPDNEAVRAEKRGARRIG